MSFTPEFLDELRHRLALSDVVGRKVRLVRKGREYSGLCPFHNEKSPSFTVNDDKAFYHCFGCGAHGDVISFITDTEGLTFPEAVEQLAAQAGLAVPQNAPADPKQAKRKATLYDVLEMAASWFESMLAARQGQAAKEYLKGRGLSEKTIKTFRLGLAPDSNSALKEALIARDADPQLLEEAGLVIAPDDGRPSYDRFRHRIIFPITDARGRVVAFGGRTLGDAKAKYLNSPETPVFHKGRLLYNHAGARKAAHDKSSVVVVEGYMDVIALAEAGLEEAVAPLGTAVTEDQLALLWRMAPEPAFCFDGDAAGQRAAYRAAERALPLIKPGHSLKFVFLPQGEDPDTFVKSAGLTGMNDALQAARPLSEVLWGMVTDGVQVNTPERRAGLEAKIDSLLNQIKDTKIKGYYRTEFRDRVFTLCDQTRGSSLRHGSAGADNARHVQRGGPGRGGTMGKMRGRAGFSQARTPLLKRTELGRSTSATSTMRERLIVRIILSHPALLERYEEEFSALQMINPELDKLRNEIIRISANESVLDTDGLKRHLIEGGLSGVLGSLDKKGVLSGVWYAWPDAALIDAERGWQHVVAYQRRVMALRAELSTAEKELGEDTTEQSFEKFLALQAQLEAAEGHEASLEGFGLASGREIPA